MTNGDENVPDEPGKAGPNRPLDEDAAWAAIVSNYGERPTMGDNGNDDEPPAVEPRPGVFDRSYLDSVDANEPQEHADTWSEEGHFVPPEPPPLPQPTPRRRLAWAGLFGAPALMLLAVLFGWRYPAVLTMALVAAFVGGFVYLVATMPRNRDDWSGDDGAVV